MTGVVSVTAAAFVTAGLLLAPASRAAAPRGVQLTGIQLASALLPASYFPSGYQAVQYWDYNSGRRLEHGQARYHLATFSCQTYLLDALPHAGFGETATADIVINSKRRGAYQQTVWQFASSSQAATFYQQMYAFTVRCRTIRVKTPTDTAGLTTQSLNKTRIGGRQAFQAVQTATGTGMPATINETLVTVAGADVFLIDAIGQKPPTRPAPAIVLLDLVTRVQAFR